MGLILGLVAACGSVHETLQEGSFDKRSGNVFDEVMNADLRPSGPQRTGPQDAGSGAPVRAVNQAELYPGNSTESSGLTPANPGATRTGEGYELNFSDVELVELAKVILRDTLEVPYTFDPRVRGTVTLSTGRAVSADELLKVFESVLEMNGALLIKEGETYSIIPAAAAARRVAGTVRYDEESRQVGPGYGISVFPLRHVSASTILQMLQTFVAPAGSLRADANRNVLLIRGSGQQRASLVDVAASFDVDWMRGQSAGIFPIAHATPEQMIQELQNVFQSEEGGLGRGVVSFQPIERMNAVLVLTRRSEMLSNVATWIKRLDRSNAAGLNLYVYRVENGKAADLQKVLAETFQDGPSLPRRSAAAEVAPSSAVSQVRSPAESDAGIGSAANDGGEAEPAPAGPGTRTVTITGASGGNRTLSSDVRIIADEVNNKLLIRATGRDYQQILSVLRRLDRPPLQVLINATIAEVTLTNDLRYGVQFFLKSGNRGIAGFSNGQSLTIQPNFPGFNMLVGDQVTPDVILDALAGLTNVKVVSSPSLVVLDNQSATLQVGDEVPISTRQATSVTDPLAPIVNNIEFRDTGVILKVTPRVNSNGLVTMEIEQEISNVVSSAATGPDGTLTPTISQRRIASVIAVYSGQMVVLGGLISERNDDSRSRLPGWRHIPLLGELIGHTKSLQTRTELVVFLRPQVIRDGHDAALIAEELRSRLRSISPPPAQQINQKR